MATTDVRSDIRYHVARLRDRNPSGFAIAFHIRYTTPDFLFQTYAKGWRDIYSQQGLVMHDPVVRWGFDNTGWTRWSDLPYDDPKGVMEEARRYGLIYGIAAGIEEGGSRSVAGFARPEREYTDSEAREIVADATALHVATAVAGRLSPEAHGELRRMSLEFTHPGEA